MLITNLALGTLMISLTVVIHTFGLMSVTHVMSWVTDRIRLHGHRSRMLAAQEPYLLDVMTPYTEHVLPMIPAGATYKDIITE